MFSWSLFTKYFPLIAAKFPVTLSIVLISFTVGILLGGLFAFIRMKKIPVLSQLLTVLISYIRCTPPITQMFVIYFGFPILLRALGFETTKIGNVVYVYIAYSLNQAGFLAEIIRSSILAVPSGQTEAGISVGITEFEVFLHIVAPQALRVAMPMLGTSFVMLFKATALAYLVGVIDMIGKANALAAISGHSLEGLLCAALIFAVISLVLEQVFNFIDRRLDFGRGAQKLKKVKTL